MQLLIGIDDTDNLESRGTGYRSRCLGAQLEECGLARMAGITRHQLLLDPRVPYTSHNSAACMLVNTACDFDDLAAACRDFLLRERAPGSDAGLCLVPASSVSLTVQTFGHQAKRQLLTQAEARDLARQENILLEGLTGDHGGIIGALAAVGLRASGQDGRFIWLRGLREMRGIYSVAQLLLQQIDKIVSLDDTDVPLTAGIDVGDWRRPILQDGQVVLLVEAVNSPGEVAWRVAPKEIVKQY